MDIKRVAFETKPVGTPRPTRSNAATVAAAATPERTKPNREQIAAIVDSFLSKKLAETPASAPVAETPIVEATSQPANGAVKTVIHEVTPENAVQKPVPIKPADFVSEDDVRRAIDKGEKIYISKKTILTPSARDLGEEKEVFATV